MDRNAFLVMLADVLRVSPDKLIDEFELNSDNWDSVAHLGALAAIDELFGVPIPTNELVKCESIGELLKLIERELA